MHLIQTMMCVMVWCEGYSAEVVYERVHIFTDLSMEEVIVSVDIL